MDYFVKKREQLKDRIASAIAKEQDVASPEDLAEIVLKVLEAGDGE